MMICKEQFVEPTIEVLMFSEQDVITTSGFQGGGVILPDDNWDEE